MSTAPVSHDHHSHADHPAHGDHPEGAPHGSLGGYMTGFILSVILTAIPFALVMTGALDRNVTLVLILAMGAVQIFVHMVFFLHMNMQVEGGWSMLALIFTVVFVVITLAGSMWVLYHMNANMMPTSPVVASPAAMGGG